MLRIIEETMTDLVRGKDRNRRLATECLRLVLHVGKPN